MLQKVPISNRWVMYNEMDINDSLHCDTLHRFVNYVNPCKHYKNFETFGAKKPYVDNNPNMMYSSYKNNMARVHHYGLKSVINMFIIWVKIPNKTLTKDFPQTFVYVKVFKKTSERPHLQISSNVVQPNKQTHRTASAQFLKSSKLLLS